MLSLGAPVLYEAMSIHPRNKRANSITQSTAIKGRLGHLIPRLWSAAETPITSLSAMKFRNFEDMLKNFGDSIVVVSFSADLCGPCRLMKRELKQVSTALGDDVKVFAVDTDKFPKLGQRYKVAVLPTIVVFKKGEIHDRIEGVQKADALVERLRGLLP